MFASVRHYHIDPQKMDDLVKRIPGAVDVISSLTGFRAYYVVRGDDGSIATLSLFSNAASAALSNQMAARWVKENAADLIGATVETVTGEVVAYK